MIKTPIAVINDFGGGQDTKTPVISMGLTKSPNMRNFHCAGVKERLMQRGGYSKINSSGIESDNLDTYYPPGYQTYDYALRDDAARTQLSQGIKPLTSNTVLKVRLWLKKVGTPGGTDTITLAIHTDNAGVPSGTPVTNGTATAVDISDTTTLVTTGYSWVTFTFATNPSLTAGTQYHLVLTGAFTISNANYILWGVDNYDLIYANGSMSINDATTWVADTNYQACFEVYITGGLNGKTGSALYDFSSKNMLIGVFGTSLYKMDKASTGKPDGTWDSLLGGSSWDSYTKVVSSFDGVDAATAYTDPIAGAYTFFNTAQLDTAKKKFGSASLLLDGDSDYVTLPDSVNWAFGTGNFTIDCRVIRNSINSIQGICGQSGSDASISNFAWAIYLSAENVLTGELSNGSSVKTITGASINDTTSWHHIAMIRNGNNLYLSLDGIFSSPLDITGFSVQDVGFVMTIGRYGDNTSFYFNGSIDEFRISKGIARWNSDFTPPIAAYTAGSLSLTSSRYWTFADWQSSRALINTDLGLYSYLGTGNVAIVSAAPISKFIIIWRNFVFAAGICGLPNTIRYSDLSDYSTWTASNTLNVNTNDGDIITGMRVLKGKLYIFKRYSIHRISYLGSNPTFQIDQIMGVGCPAHYTIKEVEFGGDIGTVLIFLTTDKKLAMFDGYNIQTINDNLTEETNDLFGASDDQPLSFFNINLKYVDLFHAVIKVDTSEYILFCVLDADTTINYGFVFDYKTGGIYPYDGQPFASSVYAISTNKAKIVYCAGYTGYMWQIESGNSDDGSAINAYWVSGKIKPSLASMLTKALDLGINLKEVSSGSTLNLNFQFRIDWNVSWTDAETFQYSRADSLTYGKTALFNIGTIENMLQVKIKNNSSNPGVTLYGIDLYGKLLGESVGERAVT